MFGSCFSVCHECLCVSGLASYFRYHRSAFIEELKQCCQTLPPHNSPCSHCTQLQGEQRLCCSTDAAEMDREAPLFHQKVCTYLSLDERVSLGLLSLRAVYQPWSGELLKAPHTFPHPQHHAGTQTILQTHSANPLKHTPANSPPITHPAHSPPLLHSAAAAPPLRTTDPAAHPAAQHTTIEAAAHAEMHWAARTATPPAQARRGRQWWVGWEAGGGGSGCGCRGGVGRMTVMCIGRACGCVRRGVGWRDHTGIGEWKRGRDAAVNESIVGVDGVGAGGCAPVGRHRHFRHQTWRVTQQLTSRCG